jgi:hypothetical protein
MLVGRRETLRGGKVRLERRSGEAALLGVERLAHASRRVADVQQNDAYPDRFRGADHTVRELGRIVVALPFWRQVQVVELAHRRVARAQHLEETESGHIEDVLRLECVRGSIHRLAPRPEVGLRLVRAAPLRAAAYEALKRVRVRVDETRQQGAARQILYFAAERGELGDRAYATDRALFGVVFDGETVLEAPTPVDQVGSHNANS